MPVWGRRCLDLFLGPVLDSHAAALRYTSSDVRYFVHTDQPEAVTAAILQKTGRQAECRPVRESGYQAHGHCSRDAIAYTRIGEWLALLNADVVISKEFFASCERRFSDGKKVIVSAGIRTLPKAPLPIGASSAELLSWSIDNQHPITAALYWPTGKSRLPSLIYFTDGQAVAMRGFHLGPIALCKDRELKHTGTSDWDLATCYTKEETHIVTSVDELSVSEVSPADKVLPVGPTPFDSNMILRWARRKTLPIHWWFFSHRIALRGDGIFGDDDLAESLMDRMRH